MRNLKTILFFALLLSAALNSAAQNEKAGKWSGSFSLSGGANLFPARYDAAFSNTSGEGAFKLSYKAPKFILNTSLSGAGSSQATYVGAGSIVALDEQALKYNLDLTVQNTRKSNLKLSADATWIPNARNRFIVSVNDGYNNEAPLKSTTSEGSDNSGFIDMTYTYVRDESDNNKNRFENTYTWDHSFLKDGRKLLTKADWHITEDDRYSLRISGKGKEDAIENLSADKCYRLTPHYRDYHYGIISKYSDTDFAGVSRLNFDASLEFLVKGNLDNFSAANYIPENKSGHWEDSLRYRETFYYSTITIRPSAHAKYETGNFIFEGSITPEYFTDKLQNDTHKEDFDPGSIAPVGDWEVTYKPSPANRISVSGKRSISRPSYLNLCWFQRPGAYINELQQGNPYLLPAVTNKISLKYELMAGKFSGNLEAGFSKVNDKIERTFTEQIIEGRKYRIYTWINAGFSNTVNGKLTLIWLGRKLKADITGNYNLVTNVDQKGNTSRNSDYNIKANASYDFVHGWRLLSRLRYQSKIIRSYSSITEYVGLDLRLEKKIKMTNLFIEGRDLLDKEIVIETISEDRKKIREETNNYNRRMIMLGATFNF